jgi:hypothetical protein
MRYRVIVAPDVPKGDLRERVVIEFKDPSHAAVNVSVMASITGDLRLSPATVSFGLLSGNQPLERRLKFENGSVNPVKIESITSDHDAVSASFIEAEPGRKGVVVVKLDPTKVTGDLRSTVRINTSHPTEGELVVSVYGVAEPK